MALVKHSRAYYAGATAWEFGRGYGCDYWAQLLTQEGGGGLQPGAGGRGHVQPRGEERAAGWMGQRGSFWRRAGDQAKAVWAGGFWLNPGSLIIIPLELCKMHLEVQTSRLVWEGDSEAWLSLVKSKRDPVQPSGVSFHLVTPSKASPRISRLFIAASSSVSWMDHCLLISSSAEGHLDCFQILAIMHKAAVNNYMQVSRIILCL